MLLVNFKDNTLAQVSLSTEDVLQTGSENES